MHKLGSSHSFLPYLLAASFLLATGPGEACILGLMGENFDLSTGQTTQRRDPAPAYNAVDDEYMVLWFDTRNPGNNDVFGQRVAASGLLEGANFPVIEFLEAQIDPWIAHNPSENEYLAAWRTQEPGLFNRGKGRLLAPDGSFLTSDFLIGNGHEISIAYDAAVNEFLVTGRSPDIRGRRVSADGSLIGTEILITNVGAPAPNGHVAFGNVQGLYLATWRDQMSSNLQGRLIASDGTLVGGPILISSEFPESGRAASLAFDPVNDRFLVVFGVFQEMEILGQFVGGDGSLIGTNFPIATGLSQRANPFVVYSPPAACFVVFWKEGNEIIAQALSDDGTLFGDPLVVSSGSVFGEPTADVNTTTGDILVVWTDDRNLGEGQQDIYGQIVTCTEPSAVPPTDADAPGAPELTGFAPNPLFDRTTISFRLPVSGEMILEIVGTNGRLVRRLRAAGLSADPRTMVWDATDEAGYRVPSGLYFARLRFDGGVTPGEKIIVLR